MAVAHYKGLLSDTFGEMFNSCFVNMRVKKRPKSSPDLRLDGKVAIVTGGNRGIGKATAIDLASRGAKVIIACRDTETGEATASEIRAKVPNAQVVVKKLDLASFNSIRAFAADVLASEPKVDILVNNAGYITPQRSETVDGNELMMQVNCFGPMLLTCLLLERIMASEDGRIVSTSSLAYYRVRTFDFDDANWKNKRSFPYFDVYGHSKLGLMLWTRYLGLKLAGKNVKVYAVDPGIATTELGNNMTTFDRLVVRSFIFKMFTRSVEESGGSLVSAVVDPSGSYEPGVNYYMVDGSFKSVSPIAKNDEAAEKLWFLAKCVTNAPDLPK